MDFVSPLFAFDQIDELLPFPSFDPFQELNIFLKDPQLVSTAENKNVICKADHKRKSTVNPQVVDNEENPSDHKEKKIIHREVERQRRQEMAALNRSLRSLLPSQYLKGKRSLSDHLNETVNYIRHMQKKVKELNEKREELKQSVNKFTIHVGSKCLPSKINETDDDQAAEIISRELGVQIVLSTSNKGGVALSTLLRLLIQQGLTIISSNSTNLNGRLVHTIESEVSEGSSINPYELQKKIRDLVA